MISQFLSTINLPFRHFLSLSSSCPLYLSSIPLFFSSSLSFPYFDFFLLFHRQVKGASLPSLNFLLSFSNLAMPSKNLPRRLHITCLLFFFFFSMLVFLCPSFVSLFPCVAPPKRRSGYMHVLKAVLLFVFFLPSFLPPFFGFCVALPKERREHTRAEKRLHSFPFLCHLYLVASNHLANPTTDPRNFPIPQNNVQETDNKENCPEEQSGVATLGMIQL